MKQIAYYPTLPGVAGFVLTNGSLASNQSGEGSRRSSNADLPSNRVLRGHAI